MDEFTVGAADADKTLAAVVRGWLGLSWSAARVLCERGKIFVGEDRAVDPTARLSPGTTLTLRRAAPRPLSERATQALSAIVYEDTQLVVIDKPAGINSVPYERGDSDTAMDLVRAAWRASGRLPADVTGVPLHIVHRIDKETSGLLLFAKTKRALLELQARWRQHDIDRRYLCVVHGHIQDRRIESYLRQDRGDGLRGSVRPGSRIPLSPVRQGKHAVTHVHAIEFIGHLATVCAVELETGKTHQIRIHLSEAGHPVVGEAVYIRDYLAHGATPLPSPRLLLHAETLGFIHPVTGQPIKLSRPPPPEFLRATDPLRKLAASRKTPGIS
jgi:23S rRNA pseudouridine1911/1915/1917 synthase